MTWITPSRGVRFEMSTGTRVCEKPTTCVCGSIRLVTIDMQAEALRASKCVLAR